MAPVWTVEETCTLVPCMRSVALLFIITSYRARTVALGLSIMARDAACNALDHMPCGMYARTGHGNGNDDR